jgi:hypothetical protein
LAIPALNIWVHAKALGLPVVVDAHSSLPEVGHRLGYRSHTARRAAQWALSRIMLHAGVARIESVTLEELHGLREAIHLFGAHPDRPHFHGTDAQWASKKRNWGTQVFLLQMLLFHTSQVPELPKEPQPPTAAWPVMSPTMTATVDRYLTARRQLDRPATIANIEAGLRRFTAWLTDHRPDAHSFTQLTRADCQEFGAWLDTLPPAHRRATRQQHEAIGPASRARLLS